MVKQKKDPVVESLQSGGSGIIKPEQTKTEPVTRDKTSPVAADSAPTTIAPHQHVTFNKDKTVTIERNGQKNTVSRNAYEIFLQSQGSGEKTNQGAPSSEVKPLIAGQQQAEANIQNPQLPGMANTQQLSQIGQLPPNYVDPLADQNAFGENALAIGSGVGAGAIAAAAASGSAAGTIFPGAGNVIGAVAGASFALGKMTWSERQNVKNADRLFKQSKTNMATIINKANAGVITPSQAIIMFNQAKQDILTAQRHLKQENEGLNKYLSGGYEEMVGVNTWIGQNLGLAEEDLRAALLAPNPQRYTNFNDPIEQSS